MVNTTRKTRLRFSNPSYIRKEPPQSAAFIQNAEPSMPSSNKKVSSNLSAKRKPGKKRSAPKDNTAKKSSRTTRQTCATTNKLTNSKKRKGRPKKRIEEETESKGINSLSPSLSPSPSPSKSPPSSPSNHDLGDILKDLNAYNKVNIPDNDAALEENSLLHTVKHEYAINSVLADFIDCLTSYKNDKWTKLPVDVHFEGAGKRTRAPMILVILGGEKGNKKLKIANEALVDWQAATKMKRVAKKKDIDDLVCPWYQPSSQSNKLRVFFGQVQKQFNWYYTLSDFSFNGGLNGFITTLYLKREKKYGKVRAFNYFYINCYTTVSNIQLF